MTLVFLPTRMDISDSWEDEVSDERLETEIDHPERREIERRVRDDQRNQAAGDGLQDAEDEADDGPLHDAEPTLAHVVRDAEQPRRDEDDQDQRAHARAHDLAQALEQPAAEPKLLADTGAKYC